MPTVAVRHGGGRRNRIEDATAEIILAMAVRYYGPEGGKAFADSITGARGLVIRMRPEKWLSADLTE